MSNKIQIKGTEIYLIHDNNYKIKYTWLAWALTSIHVTVFGNTTKTSWIKYLAAIIVQK